MKTTRRLLALITVLALVLAMGTTAFAANNSITVTNAKVGETYKLYKLFDLIVDDVNNPTAYSYTVNEDWEDFFSGDGADYITVNDAGYVTEIKDAEGNVVTDAKDLAKAAATWVSTGESKPAAIQTVKVAEGATTASFTGLADGYWLVTSTLGTVAMTRTTPAASQVTVNEKNPENTITKQVKEDSKTKDEYGSTNDAQIGDTVEFTSTITLVKGTRNVKVTDTMTSGLTYQKDAAIEGLTEDTDYTITETEQGFVITFEDDYINGLTAATTTLTLTYTATLNDNAVVNTNQTNTIKITYGNAQSVEVTTTTATHSFAVLKYDADDTTNKAPLANAKFQLYTAKTGGTALTLAVNADGTIYRVVKDSTKLPEGYSLAVDNKIVTLATGSITIEGVDSDKYYLEETDAPAGYNKLTERFEITVASENNARAEIANETGSVLPSTGGMGTTIFYVLGGLMVLGALVVLVTNKRMRAN